MTTPRISYSAEAATGRANPSKIPMPAPKLWRKICPYSPCDDEKRVEPTSFSRQRQKNLCHIQCEVSVASGDILIGDAGVIPRNTQLNRNLLTRDLIDHPGPARTGNQTAWQLNRLIPEMPLIRIAGLKCRNLFGIILIYGICSLSNGE